MSLKVISINDLHLGLKTNDVDRTEEIINICQDAVKQCVVLQRQDHDVIFIIGGDIFNTNTPGEHLIAEFIRVLNAIKKYEIKTFIMVGNHDAVADPDRLSCLSFIKKLKPGYPTVNLIEDIKFMKVGVFDNGPLYFTFLPHISRATIANKNLKDDMTPQKYIEAKCKRILEKIGQGSQHYVFSHLNISGHFGGSEENLLKKSEVFVPACLTNVPLGFVEPKIIQYHIHSNQTIDNMEVVGSQIFVSFGEKETGKYYLQINFSDQIGKEDHLKFLPTNCTHFKQLELDMMGETKEFLQIPEVVEFIKTIPENAVVKFDITINPENNHYDWKDIVKRVKGKNAFHVKPIIPRVILKRPVRSVEQKINLDPKDAVKVYLKKNLRKDMDRAKKLYKLSQKYLEN